MSNAALFGFVKELAQPQSKYYKLALAREISNHLFLKATLGTSSGELTEEDMGHILGRFLIVLQTLNGKDAKPFIQPPNPPSMTAQSPVGPEAYAPKSVRDDMLRAVEKAIGE